MIVYSFVIVSAVLAVTKGSTDPPFISEGSVPGHSNSSLLYTLLHVAGFSETCVSGVLDYCSSAQEEAHYPSLIQELQEVKTEMREVKAELQNVKVEGKEMMRQELQEVKEEAQETKDVMQQVMLMLKALFRPRHCKDSLDAGNRESGLRQVYPYPGRPNQSVTVYCEQKMDGGGWTVFQRRVNNTVRQDFYRNWTEYQAGFGDLEGEFWLGLDLLHELTATEQELRVDLYDYEGAHRWAKYGTFRVGSEDTNYRLTIGRYSGDAGDAMTGRHNDQEFSTHDADHDSMSWGNGNCAETYRGAWWYGACHYANLNGYQYVGADSPSSEGIIWNQWRGFGYSLMRTVMMTRPAH